MENGKYLGMHSFLSLDESVGPKETDCGSDGKNKEWLQSKIDPEHHITFFSHKPDRHVLVTLHKDTGELGFSVKRGELSHDENDYQTKRTDLGDALPVFNKVAHVTLEGAKKHKLDMIAFDGANRDLDKTYDKIVNNKYFIDKMKERGFYYHGQGKLVPHHIFRKIKT